MYSFGEPLFEPTRDRRVQPVIIMAGKLLVGCTLGILAISTVRGNFIAEVPGAISAFGPSGQECTSTGAQAAAKMDVEGARLAAKKFVDSLDKDIKGQAYYPDAKLQEKQWAICTIVQQCLVPEYGLAVGRLKPASRTKWFDLLAIVLSDESYKRISESSLGA